MSRSDDKAPAVRGKRLLGVSTIDENGEIEVPDGVLQWLEGRLGRPLIEGDELEAVVDENGDVVVGVVDRRSKEARSRRRRRR